MVATNLSPDGWVDLVSAGWPIDDEDIVLEAIEEDDRIESIGEAMPEGYAFSWLENAACGRRDLGGWRDGDGEIEVARVVVDKRAVTLVSGDRETLRTVGAELEQILEGPIRRGSDAEAA